MESYASFAPGKSRSGLLASSRLGRWAALATVVVAALASPAAMPMSGAFHASVDTASAAELVRQAVASEVAASEDSSVKHQFRSLKQGPRGSQTKLYVETRDAMAGMVIAYDDRPVTEAELAGEKAHLQGLLDHPELLRHKQAQEKENADRTLRILKAIPDAFLFEYDGTETATADFGKAGDPLVRLKFRPNPKYDPPSRVEQSLGGAEGTVLIDAEHKRLAKIDGTLFKDMTYGWGFLGRVDKGGHFLVEQAELDDGTWEITRMTLNFTGKILLIKNFSLASDELFSDFKRVPAAMTFAEGVELLKAEETKIAQNNAAKSR